MTLLTLIIALILVGLLLYLVQLLPLDPKIRQLVLILVVLFAIIWLLGAAFGPLPRIRLQ